MKLNELITESKKPKNIGLGAILFVGLLMAKCHLAGRPTVNVVEVNRVKEHVSTIVSSGQIRAGLESFMTIRTGGRLDEIKIPQGSPVKKGDIVLMVDVANNRAGLERALSRYRFAAAEAARNRNLLAAAAGTRQDYEQTQNELTVTRSDLEQARQKLEDSIIRAPSDGVVTLIAFKVGDFIPDGSRVAVIEDHSSYEVVTRIPIERENELPTRAEITLQPSKMGSAKIIRKVDADVESLAALASMVSQDFDARLRFSTLPDGLTVKDQVKVTIPLRKFKNVDVIRLQTVFDIQTEPRILTLDRHNHPQWTPVEIVDVMQDKVFIKSLKEETKVVVPAEGTQALKIIGKKVVVRSEPSNRG